MLFLLYVTLHCGETFVLLIACIIGCNSGPAPYELEYPGPPASGRTHLTQGSKLAAVQPTPEGLAIVNAPSICEVDDGYVAVCGGLLAVVFLFGLFSSIMLFDQTSCLIENQTSIEQLQGMKGEARTLREALTEVMGCPPSWRWLLPLAVRRSHAKA
eukprot:gnl/TRDRNA2_/TRDRNA2_29677_c0_seq2.p1 gnl/TRDRNA2_/TRDRNA2_29677_c0~~gnl/TRDRNA2_/TRDRNA2_29677_c0_seq2.p1  ORF type:complete len:157 (+),score=14.48 gnl/TRDRNA2_/TRDRNA2_29677_c0_seq2:37-507(+)